MDVDLETSRLTFHVAFMGPGVATRWQKLHPGRDDRAIDAQVAVFHANGDRILISRRMVESGDAGHGLTTQLQSIVVPGQPRAAALERLIYKTVDAVVFVPSGRPEDATRNEEQLLRVTRLLEASGRDPRETVLGVLGSADACAFARRAVGHWRPRFLASSLGSVAELGDAASDVTAELVDRVKDLDDVRAAVGESRHVEESTATLARVLARPRTRERLLVVALVGAAALAGLLVGVLAS